MQKKTLWKDTLNGKLASAYQAVIDAMNNRDLTGEITEAFDNYVEMMEVSENKKETVLISVDLLHEIIEYIEYCEDVIDGEWGSCRSMEQLVKDGAAPDIYNAIIKILPNKKKK